VTHATLGKLDDLLSYNTRSGVIGQFHPEFPADDFERERHFPDDFRLKSLARKEWPYRHAVFYSHRRLV